MIGDSFTTREDIVRRYAVVLVLLVLSVAAWASTASAIKSPQTISLIEVSLPNGDHPLGDFAFDRPPRGGDQIAFSSALYRWNGTERGARVGRDHGIITFITDFGPDFSKNALAFFTAQAFLPAGTILVEGFGRIDPDAPARWTFPVIGGTGVYANARGHVVVRDLRSGNTSLRFQLAP
jgi:hypothetical protein